MIFNKKSGITLIALVITIIVLLILAGVSISAITGENGIVTKARHAKEETEKAEIKEKVDLAVSTVIASGLGTITEDGLREELDKEFDDYTLEDTTDGWNVKVDGHEVFVSGSKNDNNDSRKINVEISQTTGEDLWNNIVTLNVTLEDVDTTLTLEQKQELAAYMLDYEDYEELTTNLTALTGTTIDEIISQMEMTDEAELVDTIVMGMMNSLNYEDVNKLEELGVPVVTITTPYNTKLYTNALDNRELKLGFVENGSYEFEIKSGGTTVTETVEISNIRDYSTESPYEVKVEADFGGVPVLYKMDEETEYTSLQEGILASNGAITLKLDDDGQPNTLSYVVKDEEYFKYFADDSWNVFNGWFTLDIGIWIAKNALEDAGISDEILNNMTSRQIMLYAGFFGNDVAEQVLSRDVCDGIWFNFLDDVALPSLNGETIDESTIKEKYPQRFVGFSQVLDSPTDTVTIDLTSDACVYIYAQNTTL